MAATIREVAPGDAALMRQVEAVHRQLRPQLYVDYPGQMRTILEEGAGMIAAFEGERPVGVAVWRANHNTSRGYRLYVDDLVTDAAGRSRGVGKAMMAWLEEKARALGCRSVQLDSGLQRALAHRFYFREGMAIVAFNFLKDVT
jgi:GNAT superfamily N-acetyltransferase